MIFRNNSRLSIAFGYSIETEIVINQTTMQSLSVWLCNTLQRSQTDSYIEDKRCNILNPPDSFKILTSV